MSRRDSADLRKALRAIAGGQGGFFTSAQAREAGYPYASQRYHTNRGEWLHVDHGIYRLAGWPMPDHPDLIRWSLWGRGHGAISHVSALAVHDLGDFLPSTVHLTLPTSTRTRRPGVTLHKAALPQDDLDQREGFQVTNASRSLIDTADLAVDLDALARAVEEALDRGLVEPAELRERSDERGPVAALAIERSLSEAG